MKTSVHRVRNATAENRGILNPPYIYFVCQAEGQELKSQVSTKIALKETSYVCFFRDNIPNPLRILCKLLSPFKDFIFLLSFRAGTLGVQRDSRVCQLLVTLLLLVGVIVDSESGCCVLVLAGTVFGDGVDCS